MGLTHKFFFLSLFGLFLKLCFISKSGRTVLTYPYIYIYTYFHICIHRAYRCIIIVINTIFFYFFFLS